MIKSSQTRKPCRLTSTQVHSHSLKLQNYGWSTAALLVAIYLDRSQRVIGSSSADIAIGSYFELPKVYLDMKPGDSWATVHAYGGNLYAMGGVMGAGYREFKGDQDPYRNDVIAVVLLPLCEASNDNLGSRIVKARPEIESERSPENPVEVATFRIGSKWYGMRTEHIIEAVDAEGISGLTGESRGFCGYIMYKNKLVPVYCLESALQNAGQVEPASAHVVLLGKERAAYAVLVDELGPIPEVSASRLQPLPGMFSNAQTMGEAVLQVNDGRNNLLILVLDLIRLGGRLGAMRCEESAMPNYPALEYKAHTP